VLETVGISVTSAEAGSTRDENEMVSGQLFMDTKSDVGTLVRFLCTRKESRQFIHFIAKF